MSSGVANPYYGRTDKVNRPDPAMDEFKLVDESEVLARQAQWDMAERIRVGFTATDIARLEHLAQNEVNEEPARKALENRLRVKFLSTKGATVKEWLEQRDTIFAEYLQKNPGMRRS